MAEPFVRPDVRLFLDYLNNLPGPRTWEMEPAEARTLMAGMRHFGDLPTGELAFVRDLVMPGPGGELKLRLYDARAAREEEHLAEPDGC